MSHFHEWISSPQPGYQFCAMRCGAIQRWEDGKWVDVVRIRSGKTKQSKIKPSYVDEMKAQKSVKDYWKS